MKKILTMLFLLIGISLSGVSQVNPELDKNLIESVNKEFTSGGLSGMMVAYHDPNDLESFNIKITIGYTDGFWNSFKSGFMSNMNSKNTTDIYKALGYKRFMFKFHDGVIKYIYF